MARDSAKKAGRLLPSHQRNEAEAEAGRLSPFLLRLSSASKETTEGKVGHRALFPIKDMPVDKGSWPIHNAMASSSSIGPASPPTKPGHQTHCSGRSGPQASRHPAVERGIEPVDNQLLIMASSPSTIQPSIRAPRAHRKSTR